MGRRGSAPAAVTSSNTRRLDLLIVLALSLVLPAARFVGMVAAFPQDEGVYFNIARQFASNGGFLGPIPTMEATFQEPLVNPIWVISGRHLYNVVNGLLIRELSPIAGSAALSLTFYVLNNLGMFALLSRIASRRTALIAVILVSSFPAFVIHATRLTPDLPMVVCVNLSALLLVFGAIHPTRARLAALTAGACFGLGVVLKEPALLMIWPMLAWMLIFQRRLTPLFLAGCAIVPLIDLALFQFVTGHMTWRLHAVRAAHAFKYQVEYQDVIHARVDRFLDVLVPRGFDWWFHLRCFFHASQNRLGNLYSGWTMAAACAAVPMVPILWTRRIAPRPLLAMAILALAGGYGFIEFGFVDLLFGRGETWVTYLMMFKEYDSPKFVLYLVCPASVLVALALDAIARRSDLAAAASWTAVAALFVSAVFCADTARTELQSGTRDLRDAVPVLQRLLESDNRLALYTDSGGIDLLHYLSNGAFSPRMRDIATLPASCSASEPRLVLQGGGRGMEAMYLDRLEQESNEAVGRADATCGIRDVYRAADRQFSPAQPIRIRQVEYRSR